MGEEATRRYLLERYKEESLTPTDMAPLTRCQQYGAVFTFLNSVALGYFAQKRFGQTPRQKWLWFFGTALVTDLIQGTIVQFFCVRDWVSKVHRGQHIISNREDALRVLHPERFLAPAPYGVPPVPYGAQPGIPGPASPFVPALPNQPPTITAAPMNPPNYFNPPMAGPPSPPPALGSPSSQASPILAQQPSSNPASPSAPPQVPLHRQPLQPVNNVAPSLPPPNLPRTLKLPPGYEPPSYQSPQPVTSPPSSPSEEPLVGAVTSQE